MGKRINTALLDLTLNAIKTGTGALGPADKQVLLTSEPTSYADATGAAKLAEVAMASGDFTVGAGAGAGTSPRRLTVAAKAGVSITADGVASHVALIDTAHSAVLLVTTCTPQSVTSGQSLDLPSWTQEIGAPA